MIQFNRSSALSFLFAVISIIFLEGVPSPGVKLNTLGAAAVEGDLAHPAQSILVWKNYSLVLRISLDINSPPFESRTVAKCGAIIGRAPPF